MMQVLLVNMPFNGFLWPSMGLSLLKAGLQKRNVSASIRYFTISYAEQIGFKLYASLANGEPRPADLIGEWIFSSALFDSTSDEYLHEFLSKRSKGYTDLIDQRVKLSDQFIKRVAILHRSAPDFIEECVQMILKDDPQVVGFSNIFQQQIASLAVAKRLKIRKPEIFVVFGGANCEEIMGAELVRQFSFVDAVVSGEGDLIFPELVERRLEGRPVSDLQGVYTQDNVHEAFTKGRFPSAPRVSDLNTLPFPDYDDFFEQYQTSKLKRVAKKHIVFETARGCWWGERNHCTFCSISDDSMLYRSKSPERALKELEYLAEKYPESRVSVVDNILDLKYFSELIPSLAKSKLKLEIFYETKANLKKAQVKLLKEAGIYRVQPGIESFSTKLLDLMKKGVRPLQNIQLLKWCKEFGIMPSWNIIWGYPGEDPEEYSRMAKLIPLLTHLPAPEGAAKIRLERFSPYFGATAKYGIVNVRPHLPYFYIYPFASEVLQNIAYFFDYEYSPEQDVTSYTKPVWDAVVEWWDIEESSDLFSIDKGNSLVICDLRPVAMQPLTLITGLLKTLYVYCDSTRTIQELCDAIEKETSQPCSSTEVESLLEPLIRNGLIVRDNKSYLSLAIPLGAYRPSASGLERFGRMIASKGEYSENEFRIPISAVIA